MVQCTTYQTTRLLERKGIQVHLHWGNVVNALCTCVHLQWGQCRGGCVVHTSVWTLFYCTVHKITCTMQYINHALTYNTTRAPHSNSWSPSNVVSHNIPWRCIHPLLNACVDNYMLLTRQHSVHHMSVILYIYSGYRRPHLLHHSLLWQGTLIPLDCLLGWADMQWRRMVDHAHMTCHWGLSDKLKAIHMSAVFYEARRGCIAHTQVCLHRGRQGSSRTR